MPFIEDFAEFKMRMGCDFVPTDRGFVFENGACSTGQQHFDPPKNNLALLRMELEYQQTLLSRERQKFLQCQTYIDTQAHFHAMGCGPSPGEQAFIDLATLKKSVETLEGQVQVLRSRIGELQEEAPFDKYQQRRFEENTKSSEDIMKMHRILSGQKLEPQEV